MEALIWLGSGLVAGWLAGRLMKGRDYGLSGNLILGLFGSLVGGWLFDVLGINRPTDLSRTTDLNRQAPPLTPSTLRKRSIP